VSKKRILAISDIHGCYDKITNLLKITRYNSRADQLILLGDYIDRGDKSFEVVQLVKSLVKNGAVALMGNHEDMAIEAIETGDKSLWFINGGRNTWESYCANNGTMLLKDINFFKSLPLYHETNDYIFVHAGLDPLNQLAECSDRQTMLWIREEWFRCNYHGKPVVFGHTPDSDVNISLDGRRIKIDTGVIRYGTLTCLELPSMEKYTA
jgi:serine/threonine protein phosphatase 1